MQIRVEKIGFYIKVEKSCLSLSFPKWVFQAKFAIFQFQIELFMSDRYSKVFRMRDSE